jgi:hypothetical protein
VIDFPLMKMSHRTSYLFRKYDFMINWGAIIPPTRVASEGRTVNRWNYYVARSISSRSACTNKKIRTKKIIYSLTSITMHNLGGLSQIPYKFTT